MVDPTQKTVEPLCIYRNPIQKMMDHKRILQKKYIILLKNATEILTMKFVILCFIYFFQIVIHR